MSDRKEMKRHGKDVIEIEIQALQQMLENINDDFCAACELILNTSGRVIVTGMGKSGHIANKIAATLASTGTPAFFVHPGEASHGDLGMITRKDIVIGLSNSGETAEVVTLLPILKRLAVPFIAMTGNPQSKMAMAADVALNTAVDQEACPHNLAPTSSTTATLAMGDALAITLLQMRGFSAEDFARSHPGGSLGKRLLLTVADLMHTGKQLPCISKDSTLNEALLEMSAKGFGMTAIVDNHQKVLGIYTDGDLRRSIENKLADPTAAIETIMQTAFKAIAPTILAAEALTMMEKNKITCLLVTDEKQQLLGVLHMHDLLRAGIM